jgi:hypothetical protein
MKQIVKTLVGITISVSLTASASAQLKFPVPNGIAPDVTKVIKDYPNHFNNLQGDLIIQNPQSTDYECNFKVNGAEQVTVTQYTSKKVAISSWQAVMLTTESFEEAKKKFKALFNQLNNLSVRMENTDLLYLKGTYESPGEEKKFTSVVFSFENADETIKKLKVEIIMAYELMEWKVKVLVYDREREDNERGVIVE